MFLVMCKVSTGSVHQKQSSTVNISTDKTWNIIRVHIGLKQTVCSMRVIKKNSKQIWVIMTFNYLSLIKTWLVDRILITQAYFLARF